MSDIISKKHYERLKKFTLKSLSPEQQKQVESYEIEQKNKPVDKIKNDYWEKVNKEITRIDFCPDYDALLRGFKAQFSILESVDFDEKSLKNINTILYYFAKDERFYECESLYKKGKPSFEKGLLIIGDYGTGKSSTMDCLHKLFSSTDYTFASTSALDVVNQYEIIEKESDKALFFKSNDFGTRYFDDVKTEREANNYGKVNLFKEILEKRYRNQALTYLTCNYVENDATKNLDKALLEFHTKYGGRVHDRLFQMFNIIEFKGLTYR
jgi:DNA replication protein DnaC